MDLKTFALIACIFSACAKAPPHVRCTDTVTKAFALQQKEERHLISLGQGGFFSNEGVDSLFIDFEIAKEYDEEEAKHLLEETVEQFIFAVNENPELRKFLNVYPVTVKDVSVSIGFIDQKKHPVEGLSQIHLYEGNIYYSHYNKEQKAYIAYRSNPFQ